MCNETKEQNLNPDGILKHQKEWYRLVEGVNDCLKSHFEEGANGVTWKDLMYSYDNGRSLIDDRIRD